MIAYVLKKYVIKLKETNYRYLRGLLWNYFQSSHTNHMGLSYTSVKRHTSVHSITSKLTLGELIYWVRVAFPKAERVQFSQLVEGHYQKMSQQLGHCTSLDVAGKYQTKDGELRYRYWFERQENWVALSRSSWKDIFWDCGQVLKSDAVYLWKKERKGKETGRKTMCWKIETNEK